MTTKHYRTCNICEACCAIVITLEGNNIVSIKGDKENPLSRGFICPKAVALQDIQFDRDRLRRPLKRVGDQWQELSWDQAFAEIGEKTRAILEQDPAAAATYFGNPNVHNYANLFSAGALFESLKNSQKYTASTVDQMPVHVTSLRMLGHADLWGIPDIDQSQTMIIIGGNPMASNGSLWTVPGFRLRAKALRKRGGELIVIDPRRSETANIADRHLFIEPATDVYLLIALLKTIVQHYAPLDLHPLAKNFEQVISAVACFDIDDCVAACKVSHDDISYLAQRLVAGNAALYGRMGVCVQQNGTLNTWLINLINIASGNFDREGGIVFTQPAIDPVAARTRTISEKRSRVSGQRKIMGEFPVGIMAEEIETPGPGQIKALFVLAGNPTLSTPNGQRLSKVLDKLELMVSIDMYINATSRHAHYILPPSGPLERDHYSTSLMPQAVRNVAKYSTPLLEKAQDTLHDWEILTRLAEAISNKPVEMPPPSAILNSMLKKGRYQLSLEELAKHPSGMDLGPNQSDVLATRIQTQDGKIDCAPQEFVEALAALTLPDNKRSNDEFYLISRRHIRSNNSWLGNSFRLVKGADRCTLMIHPDDAKAQNLVTGKQARLSNNGHSITVTVEVSDEMMPGCVCLPHGWGHDLPGVSMQVAQEHAGVSINDLTDETAMDSLSGNTGFSGCTVTVCTNE